MLKRVKIKDLRPNPFRRLEEYPILREKVDALKESIESTGFWGTIVGRPVDRGLVEIAFGHHRMKALQEAKAPDDEVEIIVRDLSNEDMLRMMARENMEEWGTSAWVELETIRATIEAYGKGEIELPKVGERGPRRETSTESLKFYTKGTVAAFLGWTNPTSAGTVQPNTACETAFRAIDMIDAGFLAEADLKGLKRTQMREMVDGQWKIHQAEMKLAEQNRIDAARAKEKAAMTSAPVERRRLETEARVYSEQAEQHKVAAKDKAIDFAREAATLFRDGEGVRAVRTKAEERTPVVPRAAKILQIDDVADKLAGKLEGIARDDDLSEDVAFLKQNKGDLSDRASAGLCQSFTALIGRLERMRNAFKISS